MGDFERTFGAGANIETLGPRSALISQENLQQFSGSPRLGKEQSRKILHEIHRRKRICRKMRRWIHDKASVIFWITLAIYILIWLTVSYVGVYVTYVAGPVLLISGALAWLTSSSEDA